MSEYKHENTGGRIVLNAQQSDAVKTVEGPVLLLADFPPIKGCGKACIGVFRRKKHANIYDILCAREDDGQERRI